MSKAKRITESTVIAVHSDGTEVEYPIAAMVKGTPEHAAAVEAAAGYQTKQHAAYRQANA